MSRRFVSAFAGELDEFLTYKRALGHPYARSEYTLLSFDRFVREHGGTKPHRELERLLLAWLSRLEDRKPVSVTNEIATIRQFCLFRRRRDPRAFVPGRVWAPRVPAVVNVRPKRNMGRRTLASFCGGSARSARRANAATASR